jgi:hypothetical protein
VPCHGLRRESVQDPTVTSIRRRGLRAQRWIPSARSPERSLLCRGSGRVVQSQAAVTAPERIPTPTSIATCHSPLAAIAPRRSLTGHFNLRQMRRSVVATMRGWRKPYWPGGTIPMDRVERTERPRCATRWWPTLSGNVAGCRASSRANVTTSCSVSRSCTPPGSRGSAIGAQGHTTAAVDDLLAAGSANPKSPRKTRSRLRLG